MNGEEKQEETIDTSSLDTPVAEPIKRPKKRPAKKVASKRTSNKRSPARRAPKRHESGAWYWAVPLVVLIVVVIAAALLARQGDEPMPTGNVVARVNDEAITRSDIESQLEVLPVEISSTLSEEELLEQMIDERLLLQQAQEIGIDATEEEVDAALADLLAQNGIDMEQLEQSLAERDLSVEDVRELLRKQQIVNEYFETSGINDVEVSDEEARAFYEENAAEFTTEPTVRVRHILLDADQTREEAEAILAAYEQGADFCALVEEHSVDAGSIENCGEYEFGRGRMVPPFEEASFNLPIDGTEIVESQFGLHIIEKLGETPAGAIAFEDIEAEIIEFIEQQKRTENYEALVADLREQAEISYPEQPSEEQPADDSEAEGEDTSASDDAPTNDEIEQTPSEAPSELDARAELALCLAEADAVLYGLSWSADTLEQLALFGDAAIALPYVECSMEGSRRPSPECAALNVPFPTWVIEGKQLFGVQDLDTLREAAGCE